MSKVAVSAEEIAKVKAEWEEKERKRKEEKEKKDNDKDSDNKAGKEESKSPKIPATSSTPPPPTHERYTLHRDIFSSKYKEPRAVHKMELIFRTSASK